MSRPSRALHHGAHQRVHRRRVRVLQQLLAPLLPESGKVLDVGCGDGLLSRSLAERLGAVELRGIDVHVRPHTFVPVEPYDGVTIPYPDRSFDSVLLIDVVHHAAQPLALLREAARVARLSVVIKDHLREGLLAGPTLRLMDWVGNARHGVPLPHHYLTRAQWHEAFAELALHPTRYTEDCRLYGFPFDLFFGRSLHFVARLSRPAVPADTRTL